MNQYIDYFLKHLQTEKDAAKSTSHPIVHLLT